MLLETKVTHGAMSAALMVRNKLAIFLKEWVFEMNPYDPFLQNVMIMKKKLPLLFHADDVMMAHSLSQVVTDQIKNWIKSMTRKTL